MIPRVATHVWVGALLRRAQAAGAFATVLRSGDRLAGAVFLIERSPAGDIAAWSRTFVEDREVWAVAAKGERGEEEAVDEYLTRQAKYDPDLWVVELVTQEIQPFIAESRTHV